MKKPLSQILYERSKQQEINELKVRMGERTVVKFDKETAPYVLSTHSKDEQYLVCRVCSVNVDDKGFYNIDIIEPCGDLRCIGLGDICYGHIDSITSAIPLELSPILRQYYELKEKHPDVVLLFRCGDWYETFCEDAEVCSRTLGITLTYSSKEKEKDGKRQRQAGFPHQAIETYLPKLIRAGRRVAICERNEEPKVKKLVKRGVAEIEKNAATI